MNKVNAIEQIASNLLKLKTNNMLGKEKKRNNQFARVGKITTRSNKNYYNREIIPALEKESSIKIDL